MRFALTLLTMLLLTVAVGFAAPEKSPPIEKFTIEQTILVDMDAVAINDILTQFEVNYLNPAEGSYILESQLTNSEEIVTGLLDLEDTRLCLNQRYIISEKPSNIYTANRANWRTASLIRLPQHQVIQTFTFRQPRILEGNLPRSSC
jgi:hypothetical protein